MLYLPTIPNKPNTKPKKNEKLGKLKLRLNKINGFIDNKFFDSKLVKYDSGYQNSQSYSKEFKSHMKSMLQVLKKTISKNKILVEVGCGQGDFLNLVKKDGYFKYYGFDKTYRGKDKKISKRYLLRKDKIYADIIVLRHVLEHVQNPYKFLKILNEIFGNKKIFIEVPNYEWIIRNNAFYDITYEHVNYFTPKSLSSLFGGKFIKRGHCFNKQYYYFLANLENLSSKFSKEYNSKKWSYLNFYNLFPKLKKKITQIDKLSKKCNKVYVWGAATKGCMFILHCIRNGKLTNKIESAVDINKYKQNKFLPISNIKIISDEKFYKKATKNDLLIISNPNYQKEIFKLLIKKKLNKIKILTL